MCHVDENENDIKENNNTNILIPIKQQNQRLILRKKNNYSLFKSNFNKFALMTQKSLEIDELFIESKRLMYKFEYYPSKIRTDQVNLFSFLKKLRDYELIGPYSIFTYILLIVNEYKQMNQISKTGGEKKEDNIMPFHPFPIDYQPKNKRNFLDHRNMDFIIRFATTHKVNILPWAYVYLYDKQFNDIVNEYIEPQSAGFIKSYSICVGPKIRVTENLMGVEFESFCKLHLKIYGKINELTNIDQVFSNVIFHPMYFIYLNKFIKFTKYYLRQDEENNVNNENFDPFSQIMNENLSSIPFHSNIKSLPKEINATEIKQVKPKSAKSQPSGSKTVHHHQPQNRIRKK